MPKKKSKNISPLTPDNLKTTTNYKSAFWSNLFIQPQKRKWLALALVALVLVGFLVYKNKNQLIAATVNGQPIFRWELNQRLTDQFGSRMLDALIGEKLILDEARKQNLTVDASELEAKKLDISKSLGGMKLEDMLAQQGMSEAEFLQQVKMQLLIEKMLAKEVSPSAQEVEDLLNSKDSTLTATDPAQRRLQAEDQIRNAKTSQKFNEWFSQLKQQAKVSRFL